MRIFQWIKRAIHFVFDPEIYWLVGLAVKNQFRRQRSSDPAAEQQKRAKAFNSQ